MHWSSHTNGFIAFAPDFRTHDILALAPKPLPKWYLEPVPNPPLSKLRLSNPPVQPSSPIPSATLSYPADTPVHPIS